MPSVATPSPRIRWSRVTKNKKCIVAAMLGALAVMGIVAAVSISLAPAHICFSIADARTSVDVHDKEGRCFNFTLVANNTSWRTEVKYSFLSAEVRSSQTAWFQAEVNTSKELPGWQGPRSSAHLRFSVDSRQYDQLNNGDLLKMGASGSFLDCRVVLEAKVRFKIRRYITGMYNVRATCMNVNFDNGSDLITCGMY